MSKEKIVNQMHKKSMLPILVLAFNRPENLQSTLDSILNQSHGDIYVSCDGSRDEYPLENQGTRRVIQDYQKSGQIKARHFISKNKGTLDGIKEGIDWFFENVQEGLIVEDDLHLHQPILDKAELLFEVFRQDHTIGSIGLRNLVPRNNLGSQEDSFRYSNWFVSHGWGTSKDNWKKFHSRIERRNMTRAFVSQVKMFGISKAIHFYWKLNQDRKMEFIDRKKCNWDIRWSFVHTQENWSTIVLNHNLVEYTGYGEFATHTKAPSKRENHEIEPIERIPIWNPPKIKKIDRKADGFILKNFGLVRLLREKLALKTRAKMLLSSLLSSRNILFRGVRNN
jgi:glycosyltransferase involved in cell wall biosynthesis